MSSQDIVARLRVIGQAAFTAAMNEAAGATTKVGTASETTATQTAQAGDAAAKAVPRWKSLVKTAAKFAIAGVAIHKATKFIEGSVEETLSLAKSTKALSRTTGLDAKQASAWSTITSERGIQTKQFQLGLVKLSKSMEAARHGNKAAIAGFNELNVSQEAIAKGNTSEVMMQLSDAFAGMTNPAQKAAAAQAYFGRSGQALLPILEGGSEGIQEQLDTAAKYGAVLSDKGVGSAGEFIKSQREMKTAMTGLKVSMGAALLPVLASVSQMLLKLVDVMQPLLRNATAVKVIVAALTLTFIAYKIAVIASTIASMGMLAVWVAIPIAIIAIGAALVLAYKKVKWFRDGVNAVVGFIKQHWQLLLSILVGPIGAAVILIIRHFDKIKGVVRGVGNFLVNGFRKLGSSIVDAIVSGIKSSPGKILDAIKGLIPGKLRGIAGKGLGLVGLASGGTVRSPGMALVGEAGPELVTLGAGARVTPLPSPTLAVPTGGGGGDIRIPVYLDSRVITEVVAQRTADRRARR